jgi:hypothetical protein
VELEVPVGSALADGAVTTDVAAQFQLQIAVLVGAVLQDLREARRGAARRGAFMDLGSALFPALGGAPARAPELLLEAPELRLGQLGQPHKSAFVSVAIEGYGRVGDVSRQVCNSHRAAPFPNLL